MGNGMFGGHPCTKSRQNEPAISGTPCCGGRWIYGQRYDRSKTRRLLLSPSPGAAAHAGLDRHFAMQNRRAGGQRFGRIDDRVGIDAIVAIEVGDGAGLLALEEAN